MAMINGFNPIVWNPSPPSCAPVYSAPLPLDGWCPSLPPADFIYGNLFRQAPSAWDFSAPMLFPGPPLPFYPPPWAMQMPAYPTFTYPTISSPIAAPFQFTSSSSAPQQSMSIDQKKALLAEREASFKDSQKNWKNSWNSWNSSVMKDIQDRQKAEKERAGGA